MQKRLSETFCILTLMYTGEDWFLSSQKMESNVLRNYNHIVQTWPLLIKSRYDRTFQKVTHTGGESAINYIKRFQNAHALSVSVGNSYSEDQFMRTFMDNFHQGGKYSAHIASHQAELRREEKFTDKKSLNISSLQTD